MTQHQKSTLLFPAAFAACVALVACDGASENYVSGEWGLAGQGGSEAAAGAAGGDSGGRGSPSGGGAAGSGGETAEPIPEPMAGRRCTLRLDEVALYQGVKVPLMRRDSSDLSVSQLIDHPGPSVDVIAGRDAVVRVFATPGESLSAAPVTVRLRFGPDDDLFVDSKTFSLQAVSRDSNLGSTINFEVPGRYVRDGARAEVSIVDPISCTEAEVPRGVVVGGTRKLTARSTGDLKVVLVPIRYEADQSGRLPDLSSAQLERFQGLLASMYPVPGVSIRVRDAVTTRTPVTATSGWGALLDALRGLRAEDGAEPDEHYYGLVSPTASFNSYCGRGCTAGIAYVTRDRLADFRVGLGIGFAGTLAAQTLAHELGHQHGRLHAPCNTTGDPAYPHAGGTIGVWGMDIQTGKLFDPDSTRDVMGYCEPIWVSDFNFQGFAEHISAIAGRSRLQILPLSLPQKWRVMRLKASGEAAWGVPLSGESAAQGDPEVAQILDEQGRFVESIDVFKIPVADADESVYLVPETGSEARLQKGWAEVQLPSGSSLRFDAPAAPSLLSE